MSKIVIHLHCGMIEWCTLLRDRSSPGISPSGVIIVDTDTEDVMNPMGLTTITDSNGQKVTAHIHEDDLYPYNKKSDIGHFVETYFDENDLETAEREDLPLFLSKMRTKEGRQKLEELLKGV